MKTWTNPTVEELEVKMTANGVIPNDVEGFDEWVEEGTGYNPGTGLDLPVYKKTQS